MARLLAASLTFAAVLGTTIAHADVISPEEDACRGKSAGATCTATSGGKTVEGACAAATCSRLDYGSWNRDASPSPPSKSYPCVTCQPGAPAPGDDAGCAVSSGLARTAAPFGLAAIPAVVVALLRRRRR